VVGTIHLDRQPRFRTIKIQDKPFNWMLPPEFISKQLLFRKRAHKMASAFVGFLRNSRQAAISSGDFMFFDYPSLPLSKKQSHCDI